MTKPALPGLITGPATTSYTTRVEYVRFLRGQSKRLKLSALTGVPFELVISHEGRA
jgi:hypothetical protein